MEVPKVARREAFNMTEENKNPIKNRRHAGPRPFESLTVEGKLIVEELEQRFKRQIESIDNCYVPITLRPHLQHITLAIDEVGKGDIPRGINRSKDTIKRAYENFEDQDKAKSTALNAAVKYIVGGLITLIALGIISIMVSKIKGG